MGSPWRRRVSVNSCLWLVNVAAFFEGDELAKVFDFPFWR